MPTCTGRLVAAAALVLCIVASPAAQAGGTLVARLYAPGHHPKVGKPWPIRITARNASGNPVKADVRYEYLYGGQVVARRSHYYFRGTFRDELTWPAAAVGRRLVFRAVVHSAIGTRKLDYWVKVVR